MSDDPEALPVAADATFAQVPTWVLDSDISDRAVRLYAVLRRYADTSTGYAFPRRKTLAARLRVADPKTVDKALAELVNLGAVSVVPRWSEPAEGKERHRLANGYVVRSVRGGGRPAPTPPLSPRGGGQLSPRVAPGNGEQNESQLNERRNTSSTAFDEFWSTYPRKVGKDAARRAWSAAVKRSGGNPEPIMAGLAAYRWPEDPQFVPHPATWLNQGRWQDEQTTPTTPQVPLPPRAMTAAEIMAERDRVNRETMARIVALDGGYP